MIKVNVQQPYTDDTFKRALTFFKQLCKNDGFLKECRDRRYFKSPGQKKREAIQKVERRRTQIKKKKLY